MRKIHLAGHGAVYSPHRLRRGELLREVRYGAVTGTEDGLRDPRQVFPSQDGRMR